jgi:Domain of unknown function (DUF955).
MDKLDQLYKDAAENNVIIIACPFEAIASLIQEAGDSAVIGLNTALITSRKAECLLLDHEMAHYHTGTYYTLRSPLQLRSQMEYRADTWMVCDLVPIEELNEALRLGYTEVWDLAEYFDVTEKVIQRAIEIYHNKELM